MKPNSKVPCRAAQVLLTMLLGVGLAGCGGGGGGGGFNAGTRGRHAKR